jgi:hypothetical protein
MAWRVIQIDDEWWNVTLAAESCSGTAGWSLVLGFRAAAGGQRAFWVPWPVESTSKASVYAQAERIPDDQLAQVLTERLAATG